MVDTDAPDFAAALQEIEPDFSALAIPKKRGPKPKPKIPPTNPNQPINNIYIYKKDDDVVSNQVIDIKAHPTSQELTFLELLFNTPRVKGDQRHTIDNCMISAGYGNYSQTTRYIIARKIVAKYERLTPDAGKILQALGFGKVKTAQTLIDKIETAKSEQVSLNALALAIKMHRMVEEKEDKMQGIQINIINQAAPAAPGAPPGPAPAIVVQGQPAQDEHKPRKPLQISR